MDDSFPSPPLARVDGPLPAWMATMDGDSWRHACAQYQSRGGRLAALWGTDARDCGAGLLVHALLAWNGRLLWLTTAAHPMPPHYPDISDIFPAAARPERALTDLLGIDCRPHDPRPWLRHNAWSAHEFPLRADFAGGTQGADTPYPFTPVGGEGVHEIAVGPIHAGTIEPGHFRFSVVGDEVLRLESRLGYAHKGAEKRLADLAPAEGIRLAGRICGDSTVAYALAYAMAIEALDGHAIPARAQGLRALLLERERIANHLGDLGALCGDAGLAFGQAQFGLLKERWLQTHHQMFGHRYLMDSITIGGVASDLGTPECRQMETELAGLEEEVHTLEDIISEHAGLQERFLDTGTVSAEQVLTHNGVGMAARAAGVLRDLRVEFPHAPYTRLNMENPLRTQGDVAARVALRFAEIHAAAGLLRDILAKLPQGPLQAPAPDKTQHTRAARALGGAEGWRGEVFVTVERYGGDGLHRVHIHDPSWQNWPLLELAATDGLVPDFPLINKSFNLAYSGHDL